MVTARSGKSHLRGGNSPIVRYLRHSTGSVTGERKAGFFGLVTGRCGGKGDAYLDEHSGYQSNGEDFHRGLFYRSRSVEQ